MERLLTGKTLNFKLPAPATEIEIVLQEDAYDKFDRVFSKIWNSALDKVEKAANAILK